MSIKRIKLEDVEKSKGTTDKAVIDNMTETDISEGILADIDSPNLTDKELKEFKQVSKEGKNEKD
ncbi:hypothetical protein [Thalassomonas haliotis]|uniref:Uncharacterized protein n=1 Tax=Thalassomonas haliotis TaxID=485448 RepID=A0ABY7VBL4_9GAMM|nr:hypothetical protein [Thalassomonas haliotis]WDE11044.1 hypothetical protein H3N35_22845 [Thalassomonas haliotis]